MVHNWINIIILKSFFHKVVSCLSKHDVYAHIKGGCRVLISCHDIIRSFMTSLSFTQDTAAPNLLLLGVRHHVKLCAPASRLSHTRVYGYHGVMRPLCRSVIKQSGCAACLQRGLLCSWPFKKIQLCAVCCKSESVSTACVALF